jgi:hypothetical protein
VDDGNATITMVMMDKFFHPRLDLAAHFARRVHPDEIVAPVRAQPVVVAGEDPLRRNDAMRSAETGVANVEVEFASQFLEQPGRGVPLVGRSDLVLYRPARTHR